jgi:hypothetical protein
MRHTSPGIHKHVALYQFNQSNIRAYFPMADELIEHTVDITTDILAQWLEYNMNGTGQRQAWFALWQHCGEDIFFLDSVWEAYIHVK